MYREIRTRWKVVVELLKRQGFLEAGRVKVEMFDREGPNYVKELVETGDIKEFKEDFSRGEIYFEMSRYEVNKCEISKPPVVGPDRTEIDLSGDCGSGLVISYPDDEPAILRVVGEHEVHLAVRRLVMEFYDTELKWSVKLEEQVLEQMGG